MFEAVNTNTQSLGCGSSQMNQRRFEPPGGNHSMDNGLKKTDPSEPAELVLAPTGEETADVDQSSATRSYTVKFMLSLRSKFVELPEDVDAILQCYTVQSRALGSQMGNAAQCKDRESLLQSSIPHELSGPVAPLAMTANRYVIKKDVDGEQKVLRSIQSILNKLTPEKFDVLVQKFIALVLESMEYLKGIVSLIFNNALIEYKFASMYAALCARLISSRAADETGSSFRKFLLQVCQKEFESRVDISMFDLIPEEDREFQLTMYRRLEKTFVTFMGYLFVHKVVSSAIITAMVVAFMGDVECPREDDIDNLVALLTVTGKLFESKRSRLVAAVFSNFKHIVRHKKLSLRSRCALKDLLELRQLNWQPRGEAVVSLRESLLQSSIPHELSGPVAPLAMTANRYVIKKDVDGKKKVLRSVQSILSKLTPEKFDVLVQKLIALVLESIEYLEGIVSLIFNNALMEYKFASMYADLCARLISSLAADETGSSSFQRVLLTICQKEFESRVDISTFDSLPEEDREFQLTMYRRRAKTVVTFISYLFVRKLISSRIVLACVDSFMGDVECPQEDDIKNLVALLTVTGKRLESKRSKFVAAVFSNFKHIVRHKKLSLRSRCALKDLLELRQLNWQPRGEAVVATSIAEVLSKEAKEAAAQDAQRRDRGRDFRSRSSGRRVHDRSRPPSMPQKLLSHGSFETFVKQRRSMW